MDKKIRIGNGCYYLAYALWLVVAAVRMTRIDDIATFKYGRLVQYILYIVILLMIGKLLLQKVTSNQLGYMVVLALLIYEIGNHTSVSKLWAFFWLTCCIAGTSEKKVLWIYFWIHAGLMVLTVLLTFTGILEDLVYMEGTRVRHSLGYDYCAYASLLLTTLVMVYVYVRKTYHWWEGAVLLGISYAVYRMTDTKAGLILSVLIIVSVYLIRRFSVTIPVNCFTRIVFQGGPLLAVLGMWLLQYFFNGEVIWMYKLNLALNNRLALGKRAYQLYDMKLFGQKIEWIGALAIRNNPEQEYMTVDNSYLRFAFQYGSVLMLVILIVIVLWQGRLLKQKNTVLLWISTVFFVSCTINPELLSYKAQPFTLLMGYLFAPSGEKVKDTSGGVKNTGCLVDRQAFKRVTAALCRPLSWLNCLLPKKKNRIFFYSNLGFRDNVKAMFDYLLSVGADREYEIICSLNDYTLYKTEYPTVHFVSNKMGVFYFLRSRFTFYSFGKYPIKPGKNQIVVNLWHGMPLKRIGNMEEKLKQIDYNFFTYVLATSPFFADIMQKVFSCESEQILLCGQPRNDILFAKVSAQRTEELWNLGKDRQKIKGSVFEQAHKIVWLPTYREQEEREVLPTIKMRDLDKLQGLLEKTESCLFIKLHPLQKYEPQEMTYNRIFFYTQADMKEYDLYEILSTADALITDYSSVYFDYMMLNRPIGFMVGDMTAYEGERGFVFEKPSEYMPGMKIRDYDELACFIKEAAEGEDIYKLQRERVNKVVNVYNDGENAERIWRKVKGD